MRRQVENALARKSSNVPNTAMQVQAEPARCWAWLGCCLIVAATITVYSNSFEGPFLFDDISSIPENYTIHRLWPISTVLQPPSQGQAVQRRPIVNLSLAINFAIGRLDVKGYHIFNLATHVLVALALFGLIRRTLLGLGGHWARSSTILATAIVLIWAVHPIQTEAVTYVIQRTELLAGLFYLLTLYCLLRGTSSKLATLWYAAAVIACGLGMGSKEVVISAPLVAFLYDRLFICSSIKEILRRRWGLYLGLAGTWLVVGLVLPHGHEGTSIFGRGGESLMYALTQLEIVPRYLRLCFLPYPLVLDYGESLTTSIARIVPYGIIILALLVATVLLLRYKPRLGFLGLWFFVILAPSSSFVPLGQPAAVKRMYLPLASVIIVVLLAAYLLGRRIRARLAATHSLPHKGWQVLSYVLIGIISTALGAATFARNYDYRNEIELWTGILRVSPDNARAYINRGNAYQDRQQYDLAMRDFNKALELKPTLAFAHNNRGVVYVKTGLFDVAIEDFDKAIELKDNYASAYACRAVAYQKKGLYDRSIVDLTKAIELDPRSALAYNNLGHAYSYKRDWDQALACFDEAIRLDPWFAMAYNNRGCAYRGKGWYTQAIADLDHAIALNADYSEAYNNRGYAYELSGDSDKALADYRRAIAADPNFAQAYSNMGVILLHKNLTQEAMASFDKAIALAPNSAAAYNGRGLAYKRNGDLQQALKDYDKAIELDPALVSAYNNRGGIYVFLGDMDRALTDFEKAIEINPDYEIAKQNRDAVLAAKKGQQSP